MEHRVRFKKSLKEAVQLMCVCSDQEPLNVMIGRANVHLLIGAIFMQHQ